MTMTIIETHDNVGGCYMAEDPGGVFGSRNRSDRRYWTAWSTSGRVSAADCHPGVMDDFGSLVPVPQPAPQH